LKIKSIAVSPSFSNVGMDFDPLSEVVHDHYDVMMPPGGGFEGNAPKVKY
jgi:hypothetical protein